MAVTSLSARKPVTVPEINEVRGVDAGIYDMFCLPLRIVGSDGAPARVVLRRN